MAELVQYVPIISGEGLPPDILTPRLCEWITPQTITPTAYKLPPRTKTGSLQRLTFLHEPMLERLRTSTQEVDAGIITDTQTFDLYLWNATYYNKRDVTIEEILKSGLTTETISLLTPFTLKPQQLVKTSIVVPQNGGASVDGVFEIQTDNPTDDVHIQLTALRVIPLPLYPTQYAETYQLHLTTTKTYKFKEQYRQLTDTIDLTITIKGVVSKDEATRLIEFLTAFQSYFFALPILAEPIPDLTITDPTNPAITIPNASDYLFIGVSEFILVYDKTDKTASPQIVSIKGITESGDTKTLSLYAPIGGASYKIGFPAVKGFFTDYSVSPKNSLEDPLVDISLKFTCPNITLSL